MLGNRNWQRQGRAATVKPFTNQLQDLLILKSPWTSQVFFFLLQGKNGLRINLTCRAVNNSVLPEVLDYYCQVTIPLLFFHIPSSFAPTSWYELLFYLGVKIQGENVALWPHPSGLGGVCGGVVLQMPRIE